MRITHLQGAIAALTPVTVVGAVPPPPPVNTAPVAANDIAAATAGTPVVLYVLSNDTDGQSDPLTITHINGSPIAVAETRTVANGAVIRNSDGTITFTGTAAGASVWSYTASDGALTDDGTVTITVSAAPVAGVTGNVALTLQAGPVVAAAPQCTGVPFPVGHLTNLAELKLTELAGGTEVPIGAYALGHWPDGSINAAQITCVQDVGAATKAYRLDYGPGTVRIAPPVPVAVNQAGGVTTVTTGPLRVVFDAKGLVTTLHRDAAGIFGAGTQVLGAGDIRIVNAFDSQEYLASRSTATVVTLEETGPQRAVIKAKGTFVNAGGTGLVSYLIRYYLSAGSDELRVEVSQIDETAIPDASTYPWPKTLQLSLTDFELTWDYVNAGAATYKFGGESAAVYSGTVSGEHYIKQSGDWVMSLGQDQGHTFAYSGVGSGQYAPGWMAVASGSKHIALMTRDFWQQFPSELSVDATKIKARLWSGRDMVGSPALVMPTQSTAAATGDRYVQPNTMYYNWHGSAKTYEVCLRFPAAAASDSELHARNALFQRHELELKCTPAWYCASKVFGDFSVGRNPEGTQGFDAVMMQNIAKQSWYPYVSPTESSGLRGGATMYGWRDFGDHLRPGWDNTEGGVRIPSMYNDCHIGSNGFFNMFARTGDQRWFSYAAMATRHFMDIDVSHSARRGYHGSGAAYQPPGEIHTISHNNTEHQVSRMHMGHAHVSGLSNYYLLTGHKRSFDVLANIAGWWQFIRPYKWPLPFVFAEQYREAERDNGYPLYAALEWVRVTGDDSYFQSVCKAFVDYFVGWWQTPRNHIGYNPVTTVISTAVVGVNDASAGTGWWTMTQMDNGGGVSGANGCNPWMSASMLNMCIKFIELDRLMIAAGKGSGANHGVIKEMLYQCANYVVKHGWRVDTGYFVYSETLRTYTEGNKLCLYWLKWLDNQYTADLAAGQIANPGWHDTRSAWAGIAALIYNAMQAEPINQYVQAYGFYGYELVFPQDALKLMGDGA